MQYWLHAQQKPCLPICPFYSGRVIRAELRGELVAAKEIEVGRTLELQQMFIWEAQQV